jgi:hypothetical protein
MEPETRIEPWMLAAQEEIREDVNHQLLEIHASVRFNPQLSVRFNPKRNNWAAIIAQHAASSARPGRIARYLKSWKFAVSWARRLREKRSA